MPGAVKVILGLWACMLFGWHIHPYLAFGAGIIWIVWLISSFFGGGGGGSSGGNYDPGGPGTMNYGG
jgi:hypothetical protein